MRTYIFTALERKMIQSYLKGNIPRTVQMISMIRLRMAKFKDLAGDVNLYLELRRRLAEP